MGEFIPFRDVDMDKIYRILITYFNVELIDLPLFASIHDGYYERWRGTRV